MPVNLSEFISDRFSCTACHQYTSTEDSSSILQLHVSELIQRSLNSYLKWNFLSDENEFFCNICFSKNQALADHEISKEGVNGFNQAVTKDITKISHSPTLSVLVTLDEDIVGHKMFNLIATVNYTGNFARGYYTSFVKSTLSWFHCNDAAVIPSNETAVNKDTSYIFFYKNVSWEYEEKESGKLWVSECWSLQEFCIPCLCLAADTFLTCILPSIF